MTVASIVQKEAANDDQMKTIAGIIYNRIEDKTNNFPTLGCQSTSDYINNKVKPALSSTSAHTAEYYLKYYNTNNDSTVKGLPAGPICSPGKRQSKLLFIRKIQRQCSSSTIQREISILPKLMLNLRKRLQHMHLI